MHQHQERSTLFDLAAVQAHRRKLTAQQQASSTPAGLPSTSRPPIDRDLMYKAYQMRLSKFFPSQEVQQEKQSDSASSVTQADMAQTTDEEQDVQGKDNWQEKADTNAIFSNGSSLPSALMAKYEHLMPGVSLGHVSLHQGSMVDAALSAAGLHGLTDGTNVAVASNAPAGTLEHEIGHVGQRQEQGFSLNEGSRDGYEKDADEIAAKLSSNQPVERFGESVSAKKRLLPSQRLEAMVEKLQRQAKCAECERDEQQATSVLMAKDIAAFAETQALATEKVQAKSSIVQDGDKDEKSISSTTPITENSPKLQAFAPAAAAPAAVFGPVGLTVAVGVAVGVTIVVYLNNGGWEEIGRITDAIDKGIEGTLQELREILNRAGRAVTNQLEQIEEFIRNVLMSRRREESEEQEEEVQREAKPSKADCKKAIKLLNQYERLLREMNKKPQRGMIERLNGLRDAGTITSNDLPGSIQKEFPGSLKGKTLEEIRTLCG